MTNGACHLSRNLARPARLFPAIFTMTALCGCMSVGPPGAGATKTFVGVVRVRMPQVVGDLSSADVHGLGLGWDAGPWLGWRSGNWVIADPSKCQLLVVIRSPAQAANAVEVLQALKGKQLCMVNYTAQP